MSLNTKLVKGENCVLYFLDNGVWKPYVCSRSINMSIDTELIETTVTGSGDYKSFEPTVHSFTAGADGVISAAVAGSLTLAELQALQLAKTKILCRFTEISIANDVYTKEAYFYITNSTDTGSFDGVATFSISLRGTGAITQVFTPPSPTTGQVYRYPAAGSTAPPTVGAFTVNIPSLIGKTILHVSKDGRGSNDIILAGTPVNQEVLYDSTTGDFTWAFPFEDGETFYILYQNT